MLVIGVARAIRNRSHTQQKRPKHCCFGRFIPPRAYPTTSGKRLLHIYQ